MNPQIVEIEQALLGCLNNLQMEQLHRVLVHVLDAPTATADEVYLAVNVYNDHSDYQNGVYTGYVRYMIQPIGDAENQYDIPFEWDEYPTAITFSETILGDINGEAPVGRWYRHVLPLSKFACYQGKTYAEIVTTGLNQFRLQSINQGTGAGKVDVKFDNVRVIYIKK